MKQTKAEKEFFKDFENVTFTNIEREPWERFIVPLSRYETKGDMK